MAISSNFSFETKKLLKFRDEKRQFTTWIDKNLKILKKGSTVPRSKVMLNLKFNDQYP